MAYSPTMQRWISQEPYGAEYIDGPNLYGAMGNNPTNNVDPLGLAAGKARKFIDDWTGAEQDEAANSFFNKYGNMIKDAAKKYCIPRRLLAVILANEYFDTPSYYYAGQYLGLGGGNGIAQIHLPTAMAEDVIDWTSFSVWYTNHSQGFLVPGLAGMMASQPKDNALINKYGRDYLQDDYGNIDTSAALIKKYLEKLCAAKAAGTIGAGFANKIGIGAIKNYCECDKTDCNSIVEMQLPSLYPTLAAMWNNGAGAMGLGTVNENGNMFKHAGNAASIGSILSRNPWMK